MHINKKQINLTSPRWWAASGSMPETLPLARTQDCPAVLNPSLYGLHMDLVIDELPAVEPDSWLAGESGQRDERAWSDRAKTIVWLLLALASWAVVAGFWLLVRSAQS